MTTTPAFKPQAFTLLADRFEQKAGTTVYASMGCDYGCANDDSRATGIEHVSVTLKSDGGYPFFTVPKRDLHPILPAPESSSSEKSPEAVAALVDIARPTHTAGRLQAIHGSYLTIVGTGESIGRCGNHGPHMENARHIAACWNACLGASTELLESMPTGFIGNAVPYHRMKADLQAAEKRELWLQKANTLHRQVEFLYVGGYQLTLTWDGEPISEAFEGETIAEAIDKAMAGFDLDARPKWKRDSIGREATERQMDALMAQRAELRAALQACLDGWTKGDDVVGPMHAARALLQKIKPTA